MKKRRLLIILTILLSASVTILAACNLFNGSSKSAKNKYTEGLVFTLNSTGTEYSVTDYNGTSDDVVILSTYNGLPVTSIGYEAFCDCELLRNIIIPNSVISIGNRAFYYCSSLTSVTIGNSVTSIGYNAFYGCNNLSNVYYTGTIDGWCEINGLEYLMHNSSSWRQIYKDNKYLYVNGELVTEANLTIATKINAYAFFLCSSLTSVTIPESVTSIGIYAFGSCDSLTKVNYTGTIDSWCEINFSEESNPISRGRKFYINDELVTKANITTATKINDYAFLNCNSLRSVIIGNRITSIGSGTFYGCDSLKSVTIGDSVTSIGRGAFSDCSFLASVTFENTSGWKAGSTALSSNDLSDTSTAATYLRSTYYLSTWMRS